MFVVGCSLCHLHVFVNVNVVMTWLWVRVGYDVCLYFFVETKCQYNETREEINVARCLWLFGNTFLAWICFCSARKHRVHFLWFTIWWDLFIFTVFPLS